MNAELPLWLHRKRHTLLDLDATIAYDDQEDANNLGEPEPVLTQDKKDEVVDAQINDNAAVEPSQTQMSSLIQKLVMSPLIQKMMTLLMNP